MREARPAKIDFQHKRFALAVREAAKFASIRDGVLEEYASQRPEIRVEMERLNSRGLDPTAWLNVISIPGLFRIDEKTASGKLLAEVFKQCELDPGKPRHWRILLEVLIDQCFRGAGAPQKWNEGGLLELLEDIRAVQKRHPKARRRTELTKLLRREKPYKEKYATFREENLRKLVGKAMNPKVNPAVNVAEGEDWIAFRAEKAQEELGLPTEIGIAAHMETLERLVIDDAREFFAERYERAGRAFTEEEWQALLPSVRELAKAKAQDIRFGKSNTE